MNESFASSEIRIETSGLFARGGGGGGGGVLGTKLLVGLVQTPYWTCQSGMWMLRYDDTCRRTLTMAGVIIK